MQHHIMRPLSCREVLAIAREQYAEYGPALSFRRFRHETGISEETVNELFGGWRQLLHAMRSPPNTPMKQRRLTNRQIVDRLRRHAEKWGDAITEADFCKQTGVTIHQITTRFGTWQQLREAAGLSQRAHRGHLYTDKELLDDLLQVYLLSGKRPSISTHRHWGGRFAPSTFRARFGSWQTVRVVFELYRRRYFFTLDPQWSRETHANTFRPGPHNILQWPKSITDGCDWLSPKGEVNVMKLSVPDLDSTGSGSQEIAAANTSADKNVPPGV
jgi:hypothetical protein